MVGIDIHAVEWAPSNTNAWVEANKTITTPNPKLG